LIHQSINVRFSDATWEFIVPAMQPGPGVSTSALVTLADINHVFPSRSGGPSVHALGPLTFELRQGEFFSVVGPSGCGKSTLLEILSGLLPPSSGTVRMGDKQVRGTVPDDVGVVFQEDASFPWLTVWDNILFGLKRHGIDLKSRASGASRPSN
jgi:NitT/TauT family transport system ATP-binding protein